MLRGTPLLTIPLAALAAVAIAAGNPAPGGSSAPTFTLADASDPGADGTASQIDDVTGNAQENIEFQSRLGDLNLLLGQQTAANAQVQDQGQAARNRAQSAAQLV